MRTTTTGRIWPTVVLAVSVLVLLAADVVTWLTHQAGYPIVYEYWLEGTAGTLAYGVVGWFITQRVPGNALGPLMLTGACVGVVQAVAGNATVVGYHEGWPHAVVALLGGTFLAAQTTNVGLIVLVLLLAPNGRPLNRFYRRVVEGVVAATAIAAIASVFVGTTSIPPTASLRGGPPHNSLVAGSSWHGAVAANGFGFVVLAGASLLAIAGLYLRWRWSSGEERRQVTWVVGGGIAGVLFVWLLAVASSLIATGTDVGSITWAAAAVSLPLGIAVAVLKHGLYQLDSVVSRTISYAIVTGAVVGVYVLSVTLLSHFVPTKSALPVAAATLLAAAAFQPVLRRVRTGVDRRFNRAHYDGLRTVEEFGEQLRQTVHPEDVMAGLLTSVHGTLQPSTTSLWLRTAP